MESNRSPEGYRLLVLLVAAFIISALASVRSSAQPNSQVRIVRLSFVEGTVTMYRPDVDEWAQAFVNTPIQQGFKVATDANSFAEVEFENGSTACLGQLSELDFTDLSLLPDGSKINHLTLARGYATFAIKPERSDVYDVSVAGSTYAPTGQAMFRVDIDQSSQRLEVFKGEVAVRSPYGSGTVAKNQLVELMPGSAKPFHLTEGITEDAWDRWVSKRQEAKNVASNKAGSGEAGLPAVGSLYGWNDLSYYGAWEYLPGYGSCWSPMMGAGWSPYSIGRWSWYPGFGYTWISGLPWGWLPFHYGSWIYPAGTGWCWLPGNFSYWSPGLVTWYQGSSWVGWAPRPYTQGPSLSTPTRCLNGQNCSTAISINTFQSGKPISPNDTVRVNPFRGHLVNSPTAPLTRRLRLPGRALMGSPFASTSETAGSGGVRSRRVQAGPTSIFARATIRGAWDTQPHAPAVFDQQTHRFVNRSGSAFEVIKGNAGDRERRMHGAVTTFSGAAPNRSMTIVGRHSGDANSFRGKPGVNNDMLLPARTALEGTTTHSGISPRQLTPMPISGSRTSEWALHHSRFLMPSVRSSRNQAGMHSFQEPRPPVFQQDRFRNQRMENARARRQMERMQRMQNSRARRQMETNRPANMSQRRMERSQVSRRSSRGFGGGQSMGRSQESMGGEMHSNMGGGMRGGGMSGGGGGSRGPHR